MKELHLDYLCEADRGPENEASADITIARFPFVIGRDRTCDHYLADAWISRRHCSFFVREERIWVVDLGSRNGTSLNGQPVKAAQPLSDGDRIALAHVPFRVRLAVPAEAAEPQDAAALTPAWSGRGHNVLVVEDDNDSAQVLAMLLRKWGHQVRVARDGPEAIEAAQAFQPDTVLLDLRLPRMDGYQVAQHLRAQEGLRETRMVAITGCSADQDRGRHREVGIDRFLTKPVPVETLREVLSGSGRG